VRATSVIGISRKQQRVRACSGRADVNGRARKHAGVRVYRAPGTRRVGGWRGERGRDSRSPIFKFKSSLKTSAIASHAVVVGVRKAPCTRGKSSKGQLQQQRVM
jgi:hypothetical protein